MFRFRSVTKVLGAGEKATCEPREPNAINQGRSRGADAESQKSCINVDHIAEDRWGPPLVDADWHAFCQAIYKGIEGSDWRELYGYFKEMSKAAGSKEPNESQKTRALWRMKAGRQSGEEFYDPE